jgi:hypothetical protein
MKGLKLRAGQVSVGDGFTKVGGTSRTVYMVASLVTSYGAPSHVRLVVERRSDGMLMSVSALLDARLWSRVSTEPN